MDIFAIILGIVSIIWGRRNKNSDGKISEGGKVLVRMGIAAVIVGLIPFAIELINGLRGVPLIGG